MRRLALEQSELKSERGNMTIISVKCKYSNWHISAKKKLVNFINIPYNFIWKNLFI